MPKKELPEKPPIDPAVKVVPIRPGMSNATEPRPQKPPRKPTGGLTRAKRKAVADSAVVSKRASSGLTMKQENFCHAYVETGNASEAYRRAYNAGAMTPATITNNAHVLLKRNDVSMRIEAIKAVLAKRVLVTVETLTEELDAALKLAVELKQPAAAITATMGKAKLHGFMVDKVESRQTQFVVEAPPQDATTEDWLAAVTPKAG